MSPSHVLNPPLASFADKDKNSVNNIFHNKLLKHSSNKDKGLLVFGGSWKFSGITLAQTLLSHCDLAIYTLCIAHPHKLG